MSAIGLPDNFRFGVLNESGENLGSGDITITAKFAKFDSNGALEYSTETTVFASTACNDDVYATDDTNKVDNGTNKYLAADLEIKIVKGSATAGTLTVFLEINVDGTPTDWPTTYTTATPDEPQALAIGTIVMPAATGTYRRMIEI